jgi:hypothetical protein
MDKETSARVSTIAANVLDLEPFTVDTIPASVYNGLLTDAKSLAGSCMSQDETPGQFAEETWIDRLHREFEELQARLQKLSGFLIRGAPGISDEQRELLNCQQDAMRLYHAVLKMRLKDLPAPTKDQHALPLASESRTTARQDDVEREFGEPVETGGHDEDRDGPIPFTG